MSKDKTKGFPELEELLKKQQVSVDGNPVPLLANATDQIVINCFGGAVVDVKPSYRFK